ncbi:regulatory Fis family protein [Kineococcus xinjiangensis]|uniref:Regulatory Fis family protein n=1 Tax=Kineococcus xinjiangensis TaxID=512762 RepID=A0A2S6IIA9_9ACTN|nr:helix-turn-helix domain-containing protein [Kineococcus xinjiangensis]PPK93916.1 regulatory Fis family protein [Kineococcus xinjiangensis]
MTPAKLTAARAMLAESSHSVTAAAKALGVSRATLYRALG